MNRLIKRLMIGAFCMSGVSISAGHRDAMADMLMRMEQQFDDMFKRMHDAAEQADKGTDALRLDTYAHNATVSEEANRVRVAVQIDKSVSVKDVIIDLEDGALHVLVEKPERVEIFVEERWFTMTAERRTNGSFSSLSCASQQLTLPAVVDVSTVQADLTDGVLTLSFQKNLEKSKQRIAVTQGKVLSSNEKAAKTSVGTEKVK